MKCPGEEAYVALLPLSPNRWRHPPSTPTCLADRTTIFENPIYIMQIVHDIKMVHSNIFPTILFEISDRLYNDKSAFCLG